jgi:hypothetical protein
VDCSLLKLAGVSSTVSNGKTVLSDELDTISKEGVVVYLKVLTSNYLERPRKSTKYVCQDSRPPGQNSNPGLAECEENARNTAFCTALFVTS